MPRSGESRDRSAANGRKMTSETARRRGLTPPVGIAPAVELTPRQMRFVLEYLHDLNPTAAARRAGYTGKNIDSVARILMRTPKVAAAIQKHMDGAVKDAKIDAAGVLAHAVEMLRADIVDIMDDKGGYKPISKWPPIWRQMLSACEVRAIMNFKGEDVGTVTDVRFADRLKVLELIGRHIDVRAFVTQHEVSGPGGRPIAVIDVTRISTDRLEQMRHWLMEVAQQPKQLPDISVRPS